MHNGENAEKLLWRSAETRMRSTSQRFRVRDIRHPWRYSSDFRHAPLQPRDQSQVPMSTQQEPVLLRPLHDAAARINLKNRLQIRQVNMKPPATLPAQIDSIR
jgi:hypothetical protein